MDENGLTSSQETEYQNSSSVGSQSRTDLEGDVEDEGDDERRSSTIDLAARDEEGKGDGQLRVSTRLL